MANLEGKVAFITGAARGQGRAEAVRLAQAGADIIGIDVCESVKLESITYPPATTADLEETVAQVEAAGRKMVAYEADVRDLDGLQKAFDHGVSELGPATIVVANAGIGPGGLADPETQWEEVIAINLTGVRNTGLVSLPFIKKNGQGGSVILTASTGGLMGAPSLSQGMLGYTAAKHGVIGLMRSWANTYAKDYIRVNSVCPTTVATPMANNGDVSLILEHVPELANSLQNALPVLSVEPMDVANAVAWLASDEARYVTGLALPVDAGSVVRR